MLLKNGEKFDIRKDKSILKKIDELTGKKWPVVFRYIDEMYSNNPLNKRKDMPRSLNIPSMTVVTDSESGQQEPLQYYSTSTFKPGADGKRHEEFGPSNIDIRERIVVQENQKDLFWFLWMNAYNVSGPSASNSKKHFFHLENLSAKATEFVTEKGLELSAQLAILSKENGLSDERIKEIGAAYYISDVDKKEADEVRKALYEQIFRVEKRTGKPNMQTIKDFIKVSKSDALVSVKSKIQTALDIGLIAYNQSKKKWYYQDHEGNQTTLICAAVNPMEARNELYDFLSKKENDGEKKSFFAEVEKALKEKREAALV
jgi:hypothetical protein